MTTAPPKTAPGSTAPKATTLLRADHTLVSDLFKAFEDANTLRQKKTIVAQICTELTLHAQVEEEIFYPTFKEATEDDALVPEALVEHATLKALISQLEGADPEDELYNARVKVLSEYVKHHVKEEENQMFSKAEASSMDLAALGTRIEARKKALQARRT